MMRNDVNIINTTEDVPSKSWGVLYNAPHRYKMMSDKYFTESSPSFPQVLLYPLSNGDHCNEKDKTRHNSLRS